MIFRITKYISLFLGMALLLTSCTEPPPPTLNSKDIKLIDSLYQDEVVILKPYLDSICDSKYQTRLEAVVDSMLVDRIAEIERQLKRIQNQE